MEETEKKKKGRPRKQAAVTENNQETSPKEGEAKFEPQALDSETPKNHAAGAQEKQKSRHRKKALKKHRLNILLLIIPHLGLTRKKAEQEKRLPLPVEKRQNPAGAKPIPFKQ